MRMDLETIKKIEFYLTDNLTPIEKKIFEQEMQNDPELMDAVDQQKEIMIALKKNQLKVEAIVASKNYFRRRTYKLIAGILIPLICIGGAFAGYTYLNSQPQVNNSSVHDDSIVQSTTVENKTQDRSYQQEDELEDFPLNKNQNRGYYHHNWSSTKGIDDKVTTDKMDTSLKLIQVDNYVLTDNNNTDAEMKVDSTRLKTNNSADFFEKSRKKAQVFKGKAEHDICMVCEEGTMIRIPAGSLVDELGEPASGDVKVEVREYYSKSDFILGNLHSMSNAELLESGGMINVVAKQGNIELNLGNGKNMQVFFKTRKKGDKMEVFNGFPAENGINWIPQSQNQFVMIDEYEGVMLDSLKKTDKRKKYWDRLSSDTLLVANYSSKWGDGWSDMATMAQINKFNQMMMPVNRMGWINCDQFSRYADKTNLNIHVDGPGGYTDVRVVFRDINSVMGAWGGEFDKKVINIPVDRKVTIVAICSKEDGIYYAMQDIVVEPNQDVSIKLEKNSMEFIQNELQKLND